MNMALPRFALSCAMLCLGTAAFADMEEDAAEAVRRGNFAAAVSAYEQLVERNPTSVTLHLELADALAKNRQWERAIEEYKAVLRLRPESTEALLGIGTVRRWQGNIAEARVTYERVIALSPQNPAGLQGLAATYALDHDFASAERIHEQSKKLWPEDSGVQQAAYDFHRQRNPQVYFLRETDLSFETRQSGAIVPFGAREEIGAEYQDGSSFFVPQVDGDKILIYTRSDKKIFYTHYFGINDTLDLSVRSSAYQYYVPDAALGFSSIGSYDEFRARYTMPLTQEQVFAVRYTMRPTTLKLSQDSFTAHKLEVDLTSRWTPRLSTSIGGGLLRDLDSNATTTSHLTDRNLVKVGFQWDATNRLSLGAKYITNPDLDNTMNATSIAEASYSFTDTWSALGRYRVDQYKTGADQTGEYLAARFTPDSHWWSEFGVKYASRGTVSGNYGLVSISFHF